jgi:ribosome recycling factor
VSDQELDALQRRMNGAIDALKTEFAGLRTGRASVSLLEPVKVNAYGSDMPLNQVGTVTTPEPRLISVQVWDKGLVKAVEKAIRDSGLGLNPQTEGTTIRVPLPELNAERRAELIKVAGKYAEQARIAVRNVRRDGMEALKKQEKDRKISEDEHKVQSEKIQKMTDAVIAKIDETFAAKQKDIAQV